MDDYCNMMLKTDVFAMNISWSDGIRADIPIAVDSSLLYPCCLHAAAGPEMSMQSDPSVCRCFLKRKTRTERLIVLQISADAVF